MRRLQQNPDTRAAMAAPRDAMPPRADEQRLIQLCGEDFLDEEALAAQTEMSLDEARAALIRATARGILERRGSSFRRAAR